MTPKSKSPYICCDWVIVAVIMPKMQLEKQISILTELGLRFQQSTEIQSVLDVHEWWEYSNAPFTLLIERICFWAACPQFRICSNAVSWDFKGLRHDGWFETVLSDMASLSNRVNQLHVVHVAQNQQDDFWRLDYKLTAKKSPSVTRKIETRYPHKYASWEFVDDMATDFATQTHCFVNFSNNEPVLCWLPIASRSMLNQILPGQFRALLKTA